MQLVGHWLLVMICCCFSKRRDRRRVLIQWKSVTLKRGQIPTTPFRGKIRVIFVHFSFVLFCSGRGFSFHVPLYTRSVCLKTCLFVKGGWGLLTYVQWWIFGSSADESFMFEETSFPESFSSYQLVIKLGNTSFPSNIPPLTCSIFPLGISPSNFPPFSPCHYFIFSREWETSFVKIRNLLHIFQ